MLHIQPVTQDSLHRRSYRKRGAHISLPATLAIVHLRLHVQLIVQNRPSRQRYSLIQHSAPEEVLVTPHKVSYRKLANASKGIIQVEHLLHGAEQGVLARGEIDSKRFGEDSVSESIGQVE